MTSPEGSTARWCAAVLSIGLALGCTAAHANDPSVKDLLGKAQNQSETKAVEDLIGKLRKQQTPAAKPATPTAARPAEPATPETPASTGAKPPEPPSTPIAPEVSGKEPAAKGAGSAELSVPKPEPAATADTEQMPSVDLEVLFEYDSARIAPAAVETLTTLGRALTDPRLAEDSFLIAGHTDAKGGAAYNLRLSQQRAESVRAFLIRNFGIAEQRLVAKGFGQRRLKDAANPLSAENRRVQIVNFTPPKRQ